MESRLRLFLLMPLLLRVCAASVLLTTSGCALFGREPVADTGPSSATVVGDASAPTTTAVTEPVIDPNIERRKVKVKRIDTENFEIGAYGGVLGIEDFGSNSVTGLRLGYHVTERFFVEGSFGRSRGGKSSAETLGLFTLINDADRNYSYYAVSAAWNALPGEVFIGPNRAYNSALYLIIGAGATTFGGDERFTVNGGFGYRVLMTDWLSARFDVRDYLYDTDLTGSKKVVNNLEASLGLSVFF